jgi:hypothetical protein
MANPTIELDFGFLVFGQIGAPYRQILILVKAGSPDRQQSADAGERKPWIFAICRDLRRTRAGANNLERCLLDVIT